MKRFSKSMQGVTLLEIMLVLAIAAMIIVMSVRYYQSATANQQANATIELIQAVAAAADGLAQGSGGYSGVSTAAIQPLLPNNSNATTWGGALTITASTANTYTVQITNMPANVCGPVLARITSNPKFSSTASCPTSGSMATFTYTYNSQS